MMSEIVRTFRALFILWKAFFKYNAIVSTNKLPLNSLIVVLNIFSLDFINRLFLYSGDVLFCTHTVSIQYPMHI